MRHNVKVPRLGDTTERVLIVEWLRDVGDELVAGEGLLEVEADKAKFEIPAPVGGTLVALLVAADEEAAVGMAVCTIESPDRAGARAEGQP